MSLAGFWPALNRPNFVSQAVPVHLATPMRMGPVVSSHATTGDPFGASAIRGPPHDALVVRAAVASGQLSIVLSHFTTCRSVLLTVIHGVPVVSSAGYGVEPPSCAWLRTQSVPVQNDTPVPTPLSTQPKIGLPWRSST